MAEQAIRGGVADILPLISAADKPGSDCMAEWERVLVVAGMNTAELGIDQQTLNSMEPSKRSELVLQKRVEALRSY